MSVIQLLPVGEVDGRLLEGLRPGLEREFGVRAQVLSSRLNPEFAYHAERQQYCSTEILARMQNLVAPDCWRLLGVTVVDLYIPILTFVFGEAQVGDACSIVSTHRLRQEFYGLPSSRELLVERLLKEAVHELGHTLELRHCEDYRCAMAPSHAVEWIDVKTASLCRECRARTLALRRA